MNIKKITISPEWNPVAPHIIVINWNDKVSVSTQKETNQSRVGPDVTRRWHNPFIKINDKLCQTEIRSRGTTAEQLVASEDVIRYPQKSGFSRVLCPKPKLKLVLIILLQPSSTAVSWFSTGKVLTEMLLDWKFSQENYSFCFASSVAAVVVCTFCMSLSNSTVVRPRP